MDEGKGENMRSEVRRKRKAEERGEEVERRKQRSKWPQVFS
jgi:hypothetical protein